MVFLGAHGVQVRVSAWMGAALRGAVNTGHRSESWKVNSCHNQGGGGQVSSQSSFTFTPEDLDVRVSVGGFCCDADSDWGGLSCSPALVTGDQQQWPSQPRGRAQPGDQPSPLGSNLMQICSTECGWFHRDAGPRATCSSVFSLSWALSSSRFTGQARSAAGSGCLGGRARSAVETSLAFPPEQQRPFWLLRPGLPCCESRNSSARTGGFCCCFQLLSCVRFFATL